MYLVRAGPTACCDEATERNSYCVRAGPSTYSDNTDFFIIVSGQVRQPIVPKTQTEIRVVSGLVRHPNATAHYMICVGAGVSTYSDSTEFYIVSGLVCPPNATAQNFV